MRIAASIIAAFAAFLLGTLMTSFIPYLWPLRMAGGLLYAGVTASFVWRRLAPGQPSTGLGRAMLVGAGITGGIGFALGFFGPMILAPGANQGPLLGIFITGPLGFIVGAIGGGLRWYFKRESTAEPPSV